MCFHWREIGHNKEHIGSTHVQLISAQNFIRYEPQREHDFDRSIEIEKYVEMVLIEVFVVPIQTFYLAIALRWNI